MAIRNFDDFRRRKQELIAKWGEKLVQSTQAEYDEIMRDCAELAKFGKVQPARIHIGLVGAWLADNKTADVTLTWHDPEPMEPWQTNVPQGCYVYEIFRCGEKVCGGTHTTQRGTAGKARALAHVERLCAEKGFSHYRLYEVVYVVPS